MADAVTTWAGTHTFGAARIVAAQTIDEAVDAVRVGFAVDSPVRALGTRHSFHDLADTEGTLVSLTDVPPNPQAAPNTSESTFGIPRTNWPRMASRRFCSRTFATNLDVSHSSAQAAGCDLSTSLAFD